MRFFLPTVLLILISVSQSVGAADIRPELETCRAIESLAYRLQCYDKLVDGLGTSGINTIVSDPVVAPAPQVIQPAPPPPASTSQQVTSAPQPVIEQKKVAPEELFGKSGEELEEVVAKKLEVNSVDQIASEVTRVRLAPNKEFVVYLANGQVWQQKDKIGKWRIKVGERAIITRATLGSYMMRADTRKRSVRAERLR